MSQSLYFNGEISRNEDLCGIRGYVKERAPEQDRGVIEGQNSHVSPFGTVLSSLAKDLDHENANIS
jgi:hypothetical protein